MFYFYRQNHFQFFSLKFFVFSFNSINSFLYLCIKGSHKYFLYILMVARQMRDFQNNPVPLSVRVIFVWFIVIIWIFLRKEFVSAVLLMKFNDYFITIIAQRVNINIILLEYLKFVNRNPTRLLKMVWTRPFENPIYQIHCIFFYSIFSLPFRVLEFLEYKFRTPIHEAYFMKFHNFHPYFGEQ